MRSTNRARTKCRGLGFNDMRTQDSILELKARMCRDIIGQEHIVDLIFATRYPERFGELL